LNKINKGEKIDYSNPRFIEDLKNAFRCGMTEALRQLKSLKSVDVEGVEKTLYPTIREYTLKYLDSIGYNYLTRYNNFFVIGETTILGTTKRSDGFICSSELGEPIYAIEIGISDSKKFWSDYKKCIDEWSRTGILGVFILFFDEKGDDPILFLLDGSELVTPKKEEFKIFPLVMPLKPSFERAMESKTCFQYFNRHNEMVFRILTISDREEKDIRKWTDDLVSPILEEKEKFLINRILNAGDIDEKKLRDILEDKPNLIIIQGNKSPFSDFNKETRKHFEVFINENKPAIVIIANWLDAQDWENDETMSKLLPVKFIGKNHTDGKWDYWNNPLLFGEDIIPVKDSYLDLKDISDSNYYIKGFTKTKLKRYKDLEVDMEVIDKETKKKFPFIVSNPRKKIVFLASGVGGWGSNWYRKYRHGYQVLWREIIEKMVN